jgi:hypothetical protein
MIKNKLQKGQAALLIIFVLGMISVLIGISLVKTGYAESVMGRTTADSAQAFYAANSGVEEAVYKIETLSSFGNPGPDSFILDIAGGTAEVTVYGNDDTRTIESTGTYDKYFRKLKVVVQNTQTMPGFVSAIHAGNGGVELRNNTEVKGKDGVPGNVYSKSYIKGAKNDYTASTGECKNSSSAIYGSAWAVDYIGKLANNDSGVCVSATASATLLNQCFVKENQYSPNPPSADCPSTGSWEYLDSVPVRELPDLGVDRVKNYLTSRGDVYNGDCVITGSNNPSHCLNGTDTVGNIIIDGNVVINPNSGVTIKLSGPVWITGSLEIKSNSRIIPESTSLSQITVVDGTITSNSNVTYSKNVNAFLLFVSTYVSGSDPTSASFCDNPAVTLSSNNESVLFYSMVGCVNVDTGTAVGGFKGALLGEAIRVSNNTVIEYDPDLQTAIFGLTNTGGWQVLSFKEL